MTRINSAIPVNKLTDEHLLAEHREIKRLTSIFVKSKSLHNIPDKFKLGAGHVLFFLNKFKFTYKRYLEIRNECLKRGFNIENYSNNWDSIPEKYFNDYTPTNIEYNLLITRISQRILESNKKYFHFYKNQITKEEAIYILTQ